MMESIVGSLVDALSMAFGMTMLKMMGEPADRSDREGHEHHGR